MENGNGMPEKSPNFALFVVVSVLDFLFSRFPSAIFFLYKLGQSNEKIKTGKEPLLELCYV
jgi:hypothetical protein